MGPADVVVPLGLLLGDRTPPELLDTRITEAIAMQAVIQAETTLGHHPRDVSQDNLGYDIESFDPQSGHLRFVEVKGRRAGAETVTITRNEILTAINSPDQYILAIVEVKDTQPQPPHYVHRPFNREPDFGVTSVNYALAELLARRVHGMTSVGVSVTSILIAVGTTVTTLLTTQATTLVSLALSFIIPEVQQLPTPPPPTPFFTPTPGP